jgi:hypothetical protein
MTAGIAIGVAVPIVLLVALVMAIITTVLLQRHYSAKPPQQKRHCSATMELHQVVNEVYTNSIYMTDADHITLNRQTWLLA